MQLSLVNISQGALSSTFPRVHFGNYFLGCTVAENEPKSSLIALRDLQVS